MASVTSSIARPLNRSMLFHFFNKARARASGLDRLRVNRSLGYIQAGRARLLSSGDAAVQGADNQTCIAGHAGCTCKDHTVRRTAWCKHRVCWGILTRMASSLPAQTAPPAPLRQNAAALHDDIDSLWGAA